MVVHKGNACNRDPLSFIVICNGKCITFWIIRKETVPVFPAGDHITIEPALRRKGDVVQSIRSIGADNKLDGIIGMSLTFVSGHEPDKQVAVLFHTTENLEDDIFLQFQFLPGHINECQVFFIPDTNPAPSITFSNSEIPSMIGMSLYFRFTPLSIIFYFYDIRATPFRTGEMSISHCYSSENVV